MTDTNLIIPDKFKDPSTGELKVESLTSYSELEKKLSKSPSVPKSANDDARTATMACSASTMN